MTCIVGLLKENGNILMGADSAGVGGLDISLRADEKVFISPPMIMGFTSSFRMGQLLRYNLSIPAFPENGDINAYMVSYFIEAVRKCLRAGGYIQSKDGVERGGVFLVGFKNQLFKIDSDFQVGSNLDGYDAVGCGEAYALGSFFTTHQYNITPEDRIKLALEAAEYHSAGVARPFHILELKA